MKDKKPEVTVLLTDLGVVAVVVDVLCNLNGAGQHEPVNGYVAVAHKFVGATGYDVTVGYVAEGLLIATKTKKNKNDTITMGHFTTIYFTYVLQGRVENCI